MMHDIKLRKALTAGCGFLGLALLLAGFVGGKIATDGVELPQGALSAFLTSCPQALLVAGCAMALVSLFFGNLLLHGGFYPRTYLPYLIIIPAFAFIVLFVLYPMIEIVYLSLFKGNLINPTKTFVGLKNYNDIFFVKNDFKAALGNTAVYTVAVVVFLIFFAVLFALWFFQDRRINRFSQTMIFSPYLIASVCTGFIWAWIMSKQDYGLFNTLLKAFGAEPMKWLESSATAMPCIIFVVIWKNLGYYVLIILAALKSIPAEIYEAAQLDAAPRYRQFFRITLPLLSPQLFFLLITITISSFKVFDTIRVMTDGGPGNATNVISLYIYDYSIIRMNSLGIGMAASVVLMGILMLMTFVYFRMLERKVHYQ